MKMQSFHSIDFFAFTSFVDTVPDARTGDTECTVAYGGPSRRVLNIATDMHGTLFLRNQRLPDLSKLRYSQLPATLNKSLEYRHAFHDLRLSYEMQHQ